MTTILLAASEAVVGAGEEAAFWQPFLNLGAIGALALLLLWFARGAYAREVTRADRSDMALAELNKEMREKVIPALVDATRALADAADALRDGRR